MRVNRQLNLALCLTLYPHIQRDKISVQHDKIWVIANYKETEIEDMKVGQRAKIFYALHGHQFTSHISAISSATTAEIFKQKTDMSNQNYIKVTKRFCVEIEFDKGQKNLDSLLSGLSVTTKIDTKQEKHK